MTEYVMTIKFHEDKEPYLLDISSMLYDIELTHDFPLSSQIRCFIQIIISIDIFGIEKDVQY